MRELQKTALFFLGACCIFSACAHQNSRVKVVEGEETSAFPAVVSIEFQDAAGQRLGVCTGQFLDPRIVLTAAHCFEDDAIPVLMIDDRRIPAQRHLLHPSYEAYSERAVDHDLALIEFKDYSHDGTLEISQNKPAIGVDLALIGYGKHTFTTLPGHGIGVKRIGQVRIEKVTDTYLQSSNFPDKSGAVAAPGDSGGALLDHGKLIGVTSRGAPEGGGRIVNQYVNLQSAESRKFLATPGWISDVRKQ